MTQKGSNVFLDEANAKAAAAVAQQVAANAATAQAAVDALPPSSTRNTLLKVLAGVATVGGIVATALTAGTVPAIVGGAVSVTVYVLGLLHPTPTAVAAFGAAAK